jgi:hypothetical protein
MKIYFTILFLLMGIWSHAAEKVTRSKVIDFEGDLVEGMNRMPLDSVNQVSEADKNKEKMHLYRKRKSFHANNLTKLQGLRYTK